MTTYNVSIASHKANATVAGTQVTADTVQAAQKLANGQAAVLSHQDHQAAWDWRATITAV
jgi:hypothetical protein